MKLIFLRESLSGRFSPDRTSFRFSASPVHLSDEKPSVVALEVCQGFNVHGHEISR